MAHDPRWLKSWYKATPFKDPANQPTSEPLQFSLVSDPILAFPSSETGIWKGAKFDGSTGDAKIGSFTADIGIDPMTGLLTLTIRLAGGAGGDSGTWTANDGHPIGRPPHGREHAAK